VKKLQQTCRTSGEAGQASIEFVLTISMTLLLIFALIDFSRAMYTASVLQWAAQNGARQAIIDSGQTAVDEAVQERLVGLNLDALSAAEITQSGNVVQVRVTYTFEFIAPVVAQITGESLELSASASMIAY
jgi:Flp pilus assembly protein TadG